MNYQMYGVKLLFKYTVNDEIFYEESIIKVSADSFDNAYEKAERYAEERLDKEHINPDGDKVIMSFSGAVDCFMICDDNEDIEEVYSSFMKKPDTMSEKEHFELLSKSCTKEEMNALRYK